MAVAALARAWGVGAWLYLFVDCVLVEWTRSMEPFVHRDLSAGQWIGFDASQKGSKGWCWVG